ncbi:MAG: hypothetical protein JWM33_953, partial [Caulobacteraceae bacterium]|nr:hypothetical protein [Caulobacteraceae bacterium]
SASPPPLDSPSDLVSPLVVSADPPGPAWWKVTKGDSTLWIIGMPAYVISGGQGPFDQSLLRRRLTGANVFVPPIALPPTPWISVGEIHYVPRMGCSGNGYGKSGSEAECDSWYEPFGRQFWNDPIRWDIPLALVRRGQAPPGLAVGDLSPEVQARLTAVTQQLKAVKIRLSPPINLSLPQKDWSVTYATAQIVYAELRLLGINHMTGVAALTQAATALKTKVLPVPFDAKPYTDAYLAGPLAPQAACLEAVLGQGTDLGRSRLLAAYQAWAIGDVPNALGVWGCLEARTAVYGGVVKATVPVLEKQLISPGKSVAGVELIPLLMKGGVIEQLQAAGYTVEGPMVEAAKADAG